MASFPAGAGHPALPGTGQDHARGLRVPQGRLEVLGVPAVAQDREREPGRGDRLLRGQVLVGEQQLPAVGAEGAGVDEAGDPGPDGGVDRVPVLGNADPHLAAGDQQDRVRPRERLVEGRGLGVVGPDGGQAQLPEGAELLLVAAGGHDPTGDGSAGDPWATIDDEAFGEVYDAWLEHLVVFFRDQQLTMEQQLEVAKRFGTPTYSKKLPKYEGQDYASLIQTDGSTINVLSGVNLAVSSGEMVATAGLLEVQAMKRPVRRYEKPQPESMRETWRTTWFSGRSHEYVV